MKVSEEMTGDSKYLHPRDEIMRTMERIYLYRMTTTSGGNLSIREPDGSVWVTPARVDKGGLRRDDIVCVRPDGSTEGPHPPSSELPFHQMIYGARPDIRGVVHAHAVALVAFSITRQVPDTRLFQQSRHVCGEVGFAPYALPGSHDLGRSIAETFAQKFDCVVLENHGVAIGGASLQHAFQRFETLEFTAKTLLKARLLGPVRYLSDAELELRNRVPALEEFDAGEPSSREKELRRQLVEFTRPDAEPRRTQPRGRLRARPAGGRRAQRLARQRDGLQRDFRPARIAHHPRELPAAARRFARPLRRAVRGAGGDRAPRLHALAHCAA
jgi:L-fuculose-phosphate aldolase